MPAFLSTGTLLRDCNSILGSALVRNNRRSVWDLLDRIELNLAESYEFSDDGLTWDSSNMTRFRYSISMSRIFHSYLLIDLYCR